jgi:hypothetical protein
VSGEGKHVEGCGCQRCRGFADGNVVPLQHGVYSERKVGPLAAEIEAAARASGSWPAYLRDASFLPAIRSWAHAEACAELLRRFLAEMDVESMLSSEETTQELNEGRHRVSRTKRMASALAESARWESIAAGRRSELGLTPAARARLTRDDVTARSVAAHSAVEELAAAGRAALQARAERAVSAVEPRSGADAGVDLSGNGNGPGNRSQGRADVAGGDGDVD